MSSIAKIHLTCLSVAIMSFLLSCKKVIDIKLNNANPKTVIEGVITNEAGDCQVSISNTQNFMDNTSFTGVSNASVSIEYNGIITNLAQTTTPGIYQAPGLLGFPEGIYNLTVNLNGTKYNATSKMPAMVTLDSIYIKNDLTNNNKDGSIHKYVVVKYTDPSGIRNYYRFVLYVNNKKEKTVFIENDEYTDGQVVNSSLDFSNDNNSPARDIKAGDKVIVEMLCIDENVYKYWFGLTNEASGSSNNAAPSNPVSNIPGGALGYFSAHTIQRKIITVN